MKQQKKEAESLCDKCRFWWPTFASCHAFSTISCFSSCVRSCCVCSTRACNSCCVTSQDATSIGPWVTWLRKSSSFPKNQRWNIWNIKPLQKQIGGVIWNPDGPRFPASNLPAASTKRSSDKVWLARRLVPKRIQQRWNGIICWLHGDTTKMVRSRMYLQYNLRMWRIHSFLENRQTFFKGSMFCLGETQIPTILQPLTPSDNHLRDPSCKGTCLSQRF